MDKEFNNFIKAMYSKEGSISELTRLARSEPKKYEAYMDRVRVVREYTSEKHIGITPDNFESIEKDAKAWQRLQ